MASMENNEMIKSPFTISMVNSDFAIEKLVVNSNEINSKKWRRISQYKRKPLLPLTSIVCWIQIYKE